MDGKNQRQSAQPAKLAIVGGGAAGMFAAAVAAERGVPCLLFERKARLGSKVLMTANGRCNFAKDISPEQFLNDISHGGIAARCAEFVAEALRECPPRQICRGVQSRGGRAKLRVVTRNFSVEAANVLLATGGASYPKTGSVGDGQRFAQALGHSLVPYRPGLIGMETADPRVVRLAGRRFEDGLAKVLDETRRVLFEYRGEVDCERFGLSGAAIYNAQRFIEHWMRERNAATRLSAEVSFGHETIRLDSLRPRPLKEAIVTIGGVDTSEVDPHTMQSKIVPGLYFAGEVMDIDGPTGGYNLTLAFATARKAVASIAKKEKTP